MTQHEATEDQIANGVDQPSAEIHAQIKELLTFKTLPTQEEVCKRAEALARIPLQLNYQNVMIGGAQWLLSFLEMELAKRNIHAYYAFGGDRITTEVKQPDGSVKKTITFKHGGFIRAMLNVYTRTMMTSSDVHALVDSLYKKTFNEYNRPYMNNGIYGKYYLPVNCYNEYVNKDILDNIIKGMNGHDNVIFFPDVIDNKEDVGATVLIVGAEGCYAFYDDYSHDDEITAYHTVIK
jgi:hypothetical protein